MAFASDLSLERMNAYEAGSYPVTRRNSDSNDSPENAVKKVKWSIENEKILVEWADIAQCYNWLNTESYSKYRTMHILFTIPTITLSTLTGTAAFAITGSLGLETMLILARTFGTINIIIGILSTIQQYLRVSELREQHRAIAITWGKLSRNIKTELKKDPVERVDCKYFLKSSKTEFDRLMEITPYVSKDIITKFVQRFQGEEGSDQRQNYNELNKPDMCNMIISTNSVRNNWYKRFEKPRQLELPKQNSREEIGNPDTVANFTENRSFLQSPSGTPDS
jgi:hypothetical protein